MTLVLREISFDDTFQRICRSTISAKAASYCTLLVNQEYYVFQTNFISESHISNVKCYIPEVCTIATYYLKAMQ